MNHPLDKPALNENAKQLRDSLARLRRRGLALTLAGGMWWLVAGATVLFVAHLAALGLWGGAGWRAAGWLVLLTGIVAIALEAFLRPLRSFAGPHAVAVKIGERDGASASDLLSASQLANAPECQPFSRELMAAHFEAALDTVGAVKPSALFPARLAVVPLLAACAAMVAAVFAYDTAPGVLTAGFRSLLHDPLAVVASSPVKTVTAPVVGDLTVTLRYPEYLGRPERRLATTSGGLFAPMGTSVLLSGKVLVAGAKRGVIHLPGGGESPLTVGPDGSVHGHFVVLAPGVFSLALVTGAKEARGPECPLEIEVDHPPTIRLLRPATDMEIAVADEVQLEFEAEDDRGLGRIDLVIRAGPDHEIRKTVIDVADDIKQLRTHYRWSPSRIRLGDVGTVQLELEAFDNDTILGPKPATSRLLNLRVMTPMGRHEDVLAKQNEALDAFVDLLAVRLGNSPRRRFGPKEVQKRFVEIERSTEDVLGLTARLIHSVTADDLTPPRVADSLAQIRADLAGQLLYESRLCRPPLASIKERRGAHRVTVRLLENAVIRLDDLIIDQQLRRLVHTGNDLDRGRGALGKLLGQYARSRKESTRRALIDSIEQLENLLTRLAGQTETVRGKTVAAYINPAAVVRLNVAGSLSKLRALLADDKVDEARALVAKLEADFGRLMAGLEGGLLSFRTDRFGEGDRFIGALIDKIMDIEAPQIQVRRDTIALQRRYQERLVEVMRGKIDPLIKVQLGRIARLRTVLDDNSLQGSSSAIKLAHLRVASREIEMALEQGDLDETRQLASDLKVLIDDWAERAGGVEPPAAAHLLKQLALAIETDVAGAYPKPSGLFGKKDRRRTRHIASRQRSLRGQVRRLKGWIKEQGENTQFLSHRSLGSLVKVARHMDKSTRYLEQKEVRQAMMHQSEALDELAHLRSDLKKGDEVAPMESRPVIVRGRIELPAPDDYQVPPEFREDIIEAMRGELPGEYGEAIKKYYETLVH